MNEQQEQFFEMLAEDIDDELKSVVPSFDNKAYQLDAEKLKEIFDSEGTDYDTLENDFEAWTALENLKSRSEVHNIFEDCLKNFNIVYDFSKLNKLKKEQLIPILFKIFDIYPKAFSDTQKNIIDDKAAEIPEVEEQKHSSSNEEEKILNRLKNKLFPKGIDDKKKIDYNEIKNFLPEKISDVSSLQNFMMTAEKGEDVKDIFKKCCDLKNVVLNFQKLKLMDSRKDYVTLFFHTFDIIFPSIEENVEEKNIFVEPEEKNNPIKISALTFEQVQAIYNAGKKESADHIKGFDLCNTIKIYKNLPVTLSDHFWVKIPDNFSIFYGVAALINSQTEEVTAIGSLEKNFRNEFELIPHLIFDENKIKYEHFERQREYKVMLIPAEETKFFTDGKNVADYSGKIYLMECDIGYGELQETKQPLCIDFGTSNTTAGTYGIESDKIQLVKFRDVTSKIPCEVEMLPTIVYVDSFKDDEPIYKFGYEAKKEIIDADYTTKSSVFYEIKRWINSSDYAEELFDKNGGTIPKKIKHEEIIKAYLEYVIAAAQQQFKVKFKRLHFTAPIKLKSRFLSIVKNMFPAPEYKIEKAENSLDEGIAVVYHYIAKILRKKDEDDSLNSGDILILDCGGGTTDLASCHYAINNENYNLKGAVLEIRAGFENGESNFGGNNITFRILQMLKIKIAAHLQNQNKLTMDALIEKEENEILSDIDSKYSKKDEIYQKFIEHYEQAEKLIPTKFAKYDGREERRMVKRNYYYLWQMAEAIKVEFYRSSNRVDVNFEREQDKKIYVDDLKKYYLYVRSADGKPLEECKNPMDKVEITIKEINRLICPDIYALLNTLLRQYSGKRIETLRELQKFRYCLSGQSCKIALFHDLLKEFIPGILIRRNTSVDGNYKEKESSRLKKYCIEGSIEYMRDRAQGNIKPEIIAQPPKNIYDVFVDNQCIFDHNGKITVIKGPNNMREATFVVKDSNGQEKRPAIKYHFNLMEDQLKRLDIDQLYHEIEYGALLSGKEIDQMILKPIRAIDLDRDNNGKPICCLFTVPARDGYGFYIWQVIVNRDSKGENYRVPKPQFETFEEEALHTFFNGDK